MIAGDTPLTGLLFDAAGSRLSPSFTRTRSGRVYRYYVSAPLQQGQTRQASSQRLSAPLIEEAVRVALARASQAPTETPLTSLLLPVRRIDLVRDGLCLTVYRAKASRPLRAQLEPHADPALGELLVPACLRSRGGRAWATAPTGKDHARRDPVLIAGLQKAHRLAAAAGWELDGTVDLAVSAAPENTYERNLVRLAFLAPELQKTILEGRQPAHLTLEQLVRGAIPLDWRAQAVLFSAKTTPPSP